MFTIDRHPTNHDYNIYYNNCNVSRIVEISGKYRYCGGIPATFETLQEACEYIFKMFHGVTSVEL